LSRFEGNSTDVVDDLINGYDYTYDLANRVTSMDVESPLYSQESVTLYEYNAFSELTDASYTQSNYDESYAYDLNGNRTSAENAVDGVSGSQTYTTTANNQLYSDGEYTYTYDAEGNRLSRSKTGEYTEYSWDHRNRLTSVTEYTSSAKTTEVQDVTYTYDDLNQMLTRKVDHATDGVTNRAFVYQDGQMVMQFDAEGTGALEL
jgi:uncharacterized protein RhaS with RHS repeats